jgi:ParB-like chromosome segregation protein Spo0J
VNVVHLKQAGLFDESFKPNHHDGVKSALEAISFIEFLDLPQRVDAINSIRERLHELSPFSTEPVDFVRWVKNTDVAANDYNPNSVAPPEMELLRLSIMADGYTQPVVTNKEEEGLVVIDGFHRNRVGKECEDVQKRVHGYLPVVQIRQSQTDLTDRMASTIRHNRARGKHRVEAMSDIVIELKKRNWSDDKIAKNLGMEPDEVLRLCQISGLSELFQDQDFSASWDIDNFDAIEVDLELESEPVE